MTSPPVPGSPAREATARWHRWSPHLRGHLLLFDRRPEAADDPRAGARLLLAALLLESARLAAMAWLFPRVPLVALLPLLTALGLALVPVVAGIPLTQIGFRPWREWTMTEKSYLIQVVVLANVVFPLVLAAPLRARIADDGLASSLVHVFLPFLFFGFYQELVYRGMVQRELVRRWGTAAGIVTANVLFTFGPLHWSYLVTRSSVAVPLFAATFAIGLLFGLVYRRSGNLWIVALFHAIGNAYIVWGAGAPGASGLAVFRAWP